MNHLTEQQKQVLEQALRKEKEALLVQLDSETHNNAAEEQDNLFTASHRDTNELSTNDNHPADLGTDLFEKSKEMALDRQYKSKLKQVEHALQQISKPEYGNCTQCGQPIPFERLEAMPSTTTCIHHSNIEAFSSMEDPSDLEPSSLQSTRRAYSASNKDVDTWKIVESWGNSDSPAMADPSEFSSEEDDFYTDADENTGFVEPIEGFLATDLYGEQSIIVRNQAYESFIEHYDDEYDHGTVTD